MYNNHYRNRVFHSDFKHYIVSSKLIDAIFKFADEKNKLNNQNIQYVKGQGKETESSNKTIATEQRILGSTKG
jgi:hypothetical protein